MTEKEFNDARLENERQHYEAAQHDEWLLDELPRAVERAFDKYKRRTGDHWSWEYAITESTAEDFVREVLNDLRLLPNIPREPDAQN
jgi:hypothetical protein